MTASGLGRRRRWTGQPLRVRFGRRRSRQPPGGSRQLRVAGSHGGHCGKTLPLPCVSTAFVTKTLPFLAVHRRRVRARRVAAAREAAARCTELVEDSAGWHGR